MVKYSFKFKDIVIGFWIKHLGYKLPKIKYIELNESWCSFAVNKFTFYVKKGLFQSGELEYIWAEVFTSYKRNPHAYVNERIRINEGDVVIDAGACEGFFGSFALEHGAQQVIMFEPVPELVEGLKRTFMEEEKANRVKVIQFGLLDSLTEIVLTNTEQQICCATTVKGVSDKKLLAVSLDEYATQNKVEKIDFIKMDIEGVEIEAVRGMVNVIKQCKPRLSIAVYHNYENAQKIKEILLEIHPDYNITFNGCYMFERPYRPYLLLAY